MKDLIHAILYGIGLFFLILIGQHIFGEHEFHLTRFHGAEDAAIYAAIGFWGGLHWCRRMAKNAAAKKSQ